MEADLSEPYSIFVYRYFCSAFPFLTFVANEKKGGKAVGAIVCKLDRKKNRMGIGSLKSGYIGMLAVAPEFRREKLGSALVRLAVAAMADEGCDQVVLETEIANGPAVALYLNLGFVRERLLTKYYINSNNAFRLVLYMDRPAPPKEEAAAATPAPEAEPATATA